MLHAGTCPKCEQGVRGFRTCGSTPLLMCDECEAVWATPDAADAFFPPQPDLPSPVSGRSLIGADAHWCSAAEVEAAGWSSCVEGEVEAGDVSGSGIDPVVVYFDDTSETKSLGRWSDQSGADDRFDVVPTGGTEVELVVIDSEVSRQAPHISIALKAKKHVVAKLPWGDVTETRELVSLAEEHRRSLAGLLQWPHHPRTQAIRNAIDDGQIGPVRRIIIGRSEPDNLGIDRLLLEAVLASMWACDAPPTSGTTTALTADAATVTLEFDTAVALIDVSDDLPKRQWIEIVGYNGSIVCDDFFEPASSTETRFWIHGPDGGSRTVSLAPADGCLATLVATFREIRTGAVNSGEAIADATEVALRLLERDVDADLA